jgi:hypothetical protein
MCEMLRDFILRTLFEEAHRVHVPQAEVARDGGGPVRQRKGNGKLVIQAL